jgi:hypothetical protein
LRSDQTGALEAVDRILNRGGDADDVLRAVLAVLERLFDYAAIDFVEGDHVVRGPEAGRRTARPASFAVTYEGRTIGALLVAGAREDDRPFLERVAILISPYVLLGWDTGGVPWPES